MSSAKALAGQQSEEAEEEPEGGEHLFLEVAASSRSFLSRAHKSAQALTLQHSTCVCVLPPLSCLPRAGSSEPRSSRSKHGAFHVHLWLIRLVK